MRRITYEEAVRRMERGEVVGVTAFLNARIKDGIFQVNEKCNPPDGGWVAFDEGAITEQNWHSMRTYIPYSDVRPGDFLETPAGDLEISHFCDEDKDFSPALAAGGCTFETWDLEALGIKAYTGPERGPLVRVYNGKVTGAGEYPPSAYLPCSPAFYEFFSNAVRCLGLGAKYKITIEERD